MKKEIIADEIFENGQILTVEVAKGLLGKRIAVTSPEDRMNRPWVREFVVGSLLIEWDWAAGQAYPEDKFATRQEHWASYMNNHQIASKRSRLLLLDDKGERQAVAEINPSLSFFSEPTFHGSDADRAVFYVEVSENEN